MLAEKLHRRRRRRSLERDRRSPDIVDRIRANVMSGGDANGYSNEMIEAWVLMLDARDEIVRLRREQRSTNNGR